MVIPTYVLILFLIALIVCLQGNLSDDIISNTTKLDNIQKINITLIVVVLCYICLYIGKDVL